MASDSDSVTPDGLTPTNFMEKTLPEPPTTPKLSEATIMNGFGNTPRSQKKLPQTPTRSPMKQTSPLTPRFKKKVPWKGKNIMILLPRDSDRGKPGHAPMPLDKNDVARVMASWEELGYSTSGFQLDDTRGFIETGNQSQSRREWPTWEDLASDRQQRHYKVTLPDLNSWKTYVQELQEAKLRALGVTLGGEDPPPSSISPAPISRQPSVTHYPPLPFSPPLPTSSAASNGGQFPFPAAFVGSGAPSPGIPGVVSPVPFHSKFNPRQSISIPAGGFHMNGALPSPHGYSPQMMFHQGHARGGSPSLANLSSMMSPTSPFQPDHFGQSAHQRHQSMQFPMLGHQVFQSARASPRLQELREDDEEAEEQVPVQSVEVGVGSSHNTSDSLQREIDAAEFQLATQGAEYHLEEQMRSQLEHDKDYSPHKDTDEAGFPHGIHARGPSVQFAPQVERFREDSTEGVLHQPQPHSRGHSLSQKYFQEPEGDSTDDSVPKSQDVASTPGSIPPVQPMEFDFGDASQKHQASFSVTSNPWSEAGSTKSHASRRGGHRSQASLSGLNVEAPEFKFNPGGSFQPSQFSFTSDSFQPTTTTVFQAGTTTNVPKMPLSADSSTFSFGSSKINAAAPAFSPGQSDFNFSASGPKFRPNAPAFTPLHSFTNSLTSPPLSGNEGPGGSLGGSIFGNIDLSASDGAKALKKTNAIPIIRPESRDHAKEAEAQYDESGRVVDISRFKRAKARSDDGDDVPMFAEPMAPTPMTEAQPEDLPQSDNIHVDVKSGDEHNGDLTMSSTLSDGVDEKATISPPLVPPQTSSLNWTPFEFKSTVDVQSFDATRPFGEDGGFRKQHKKSLSATAQPFVPSTFMFSAPKVDATKAEETADETTGDEAMEDEVAHETASEAEEHLTDRDAEGETLDESAELERPATSQSSTLTTDLNVTQPLAASTPSPAAPTKNGLAASRYAASPSPPPQRKVSGLSASRYAVSSPVVSEDENNGDHARDLSDRGQPLLIIPPKMDDLRNHNDPPEQTPASERAGASFEEIDDIMRQLDSDPSHGVNRTLESSQWQQLSPRHNISLAAVTNSMSLRLAPNEVFRSDAPSPSPARNRAQPVDAQQPLLSTEVEDPFIDQPTGSQFSGSNIHHLQGSETAPDSDWERAFSDEQHEILESRVNFFDGHVNEVVGRLLASRLRPVEKTLESIHSALAGRRPTSSRLDRRSTSADIQHSDADDEDDDVPTMRRSMSPRRDRRLDQIRVAVMEALATQQRNALPAPAKADSEDGISAVMKAVEDMKEQFGKSLHLDFRGEDLRNIVEDAVERRMVPTPQPVAVKGQDELSEKFNELQSKYADLEQRLRLEESKVETELVLRRTAEDRTAEYHRNLDMAETKLEVEIMNRSVYDQRVNDLEERLRIQEEKAEEEVLNRRNAEDRLAENQRLLRISSEEETRLREALEDMEQKVKAAEDTRGKTTMRLALLEASQTNSQKSQVDNQNKINAIEAELREARQDARNWKAEAERVNSIARIQGSDLAQVNTESKHLKKIVDTLGIQLEENERIRESWRGKFVSLQADMTDAAARITEENARRIKKEQELLARQEVLDAKLQAEARTRERLESELERLENGERQGIRAVNECKRLDIILEEMRTENHQLQQSSARYQLEFQEARDSAAREVQRTRDAMQSQIDQANHEVNVVREELEDQVQRARSQLDQVKLDADTAKAKYEMLLEDAQATHKAEIEALARKQQGEIEDLQERHERVVNNTTEDAQRLEQNLLERLSISNSKSTNLQERILHLEERLEIVKEAAAAAARAAKMSPVAGEQSIQSPLLAKPPAASRSMELPEKISPQALRESIMVLQEQLQAREQAIEELEHNISKLDPDAETKITKRDDEIVWLRELLAVRHSDLQDVIAALDSDDYDRNAVKDAAIRLKANLQMEEQERERAMNGGSAINLPNIAASLRDAATPRVAQAVGPLAAAWGNWRKSRESSSSSTPAVRPGHRSTPSKNSQTSQGGNSNLFSGLMTPPASGLRQTPQSQQQQQPTAFSSTGRRLTAQQLANRSRTMSSSSSAPRSADNKMLPAQGTPSRGAPRTPPMMRPSSYDADAHAEEFDDAGFYDDE